MTDNHGDFKFDNLEENSSVYTIEIAYPDREKKTLEVDLKASMYIGTIWL